MQTINRIYGGITNGNVVIPRDMLLTQRHDGYFCVFGENNSRKTSYIANYGCYLKDHSPATNVVFIPTERNASIQIDNMSTAIGETIEQLTNTFQQMVHSGHKTPNHWLQYVEKMTSSLLSENETVQKTELEKDLKEFFPDSFQIKTSVMHGDSIPLKLHGSGIRSIALILAAVKHPKSDVVIIDEPELSLEPRLQRKLYEFLLENSSKKKIVVASHSHIFLNRTRPEFNFSVSVQPDKNPKLNPIKDERELAEVVIDRLGISPYDSFLPNSMILVEGSSDEIIVKKYLELSGINKAFVYVMKGVDKSEEKAKHLKEHLSLFFRGSNNYYLYKDRIYILIDTLDSKQHKELIKLLNTHCSGFWSQLSDDYENGKDILNALPESIYSKSGKSKTDEIVRIEKLRGETKGIEKSRLAEILKNNITLEDLDSVHLSGLKKAIGFLKTFESTT